MKTIVKSSNIHGRGIFAQAPFGVGDKIEECEVIEFSVMDKEFVNKTNIFNYYFEFEDGSGGGRFRKWVFV